MLISDKIRGKCLPVISSVAINNIEVVNLIKIVLERIGGKDSRHPRIKNHPRIAVFPRFVASDISIANYIQILPRRLVVSGVR